MSREHQQLRIRVPPELKDALDESAAENNRTLTAEIVYRLQQSYPSEKLEPKLVTEKEIQSKYFQIALTERVLKNSKDKLATMDKNGNEREIAMLTAQIKFTEENIKKYEEELTWLFNAFNEQQSKENNK